MYNVFWAQVHLLFHQTRVYMKYLYKDLNALNFRGFKSLIYIGMSLLCICILYSISVACFTNKLFHIFVFIIKLVLRLLFTLLIDLSYQIDDRSNLHVGPCMAIAKKNSHSLYHKTMLLTIGGSWSHCNSF